MSGIGVSSLPYVRNIGIGIQGINLNIMIVGSNGLGKTTFLNNFLGVEVLKYQPFKEKVQNKYWYNEDICNIQVSKLELVEPNFITKMMIVEVDGIGDYVNNLGCHEPVIEIIENGFIDYEKQHEENVKMLINDKRIHLCFYMIEPLNYLGVADLETMKAISKYCNLIPIIGKSDILNEKKITKIKNSIRDELELNGINFFDNPSNGFEAPFLISNPNLENTKRKYFWGNLETEGIKWNEFKKLKKFILEHSVVYLKNETEFFYDNYRTSKLAEHLIIDNKESNKGIMVKLDDCKKEIQKLKERIKKKKKEWIQNKNLEEEEEK